MSERDADENSLDADEITDSINRIEKKVSTINVKLHTMKLMLQDLHQHQGILKRLSQVFRLSDRTRIVILVACLWGVVSASIVWLFMKLF